MWNLKELNTDISLYIALADAMERDIRSGVLPPGTRLPAQRELAHTVGVNITTVTRAYREAERRGLITACVGKGTFVAKDAGSHASLVETRGMDVPSGITAPTLIDMNLAKPLYLFEPDVSALLQKVATSPELSEYMKYSPPEGMPSHRQTGADYARRIGLPVQPDQVIITSGAHHAFDCILHALFEPGDRIAVDCYTYPGFKSALRRLGLKAEGIPMDSQGMIPSELEKACRRTPIKGIYSMPGIQNPTCALRGTKRTQDLCRVIQRHGLISIEDDMYGYLTSEGTSSIMACLPEQSLYIAGLSKICYAGLRTAFVYLPRRFRHLVCQEIIDTTWMSSALTAAVACECITSGLMDTIMKDKREEILRRSQLLPSALMGLAYQYTPGSMFAWVTLPDGFTGDSFHLACLEAGINIAPSSKFTVGSDISTDFFRLSLVGTDTFTQFSQGLYLLAEILRNPPAVNTPL